MNILARAVVVTLLVAASSACGKLQARTQPIRPPLDTPPPPPHVIVPVAADPIAQAPPPPARPPARTAPRPPAKPLPAAAAPPPSTPDDGAPRRSLQTTTNVAETEQKIRTVLARASQDLARINQGSLKGEAQAQYDIAKRFIQQAEEALKVKNLVFAEQLADKAATLATLLLNR